jgi:hypothetical protein
MASLPAGGRRVIPLPGGWPQGPAGRRSPAAWVVAPLVRSAAASGAAAAVASGLLLAARRLAGGFAAADSGLVWMTLGGGLVLLGVADSGRRAGAPLAWSLAARAGILLAVAAVALPPRAGDWAAILALAIAAAVGVLPPPRVRGGRDQWRAWSPRPQAATRPAVAERGSAAVSPPPPPAAPAPAAEPPAAHPSPILSSAALGRLHQRLERYESAEGIDCVWGHVRLSIPAGGKATHAHIGFCPAFTATPTVEVSTDYDGVEALVTAAEVLPWGVRIECRLSEPAEEPLEIPVDLVAQSPR